MQQRVADTHNEGAAARSIDNSFRSHRQLSAVRGMLCTKTSNRQQSTSAPYISKNSVSIWFLVDNRQCHGNRKQFQHCYIINRVNIEGTE